nr:hypothetical protein [uncultured Flavobacterium sp.]
MPPASAGGKGMNVKLALAKKSTILAKAISYHYNFISPAEARGNLII